MKKVIVKTTEELIDLVRETIGKEGYECDLNFIDTSEITNMSWLFYNSKFSGNISRWNTSNVTSMDNMFNGSEFNGDISKWNTGKVISMFCMFADSNFNQDIGNWDTSNVTDMCDMFEYSLFNQDISKWNTRNVKDYRKFGLYNESYLPPKFRNPLEQCKSYLGWKKLHNDLICKLFIPEDAIKLKGGSSNKCRTNKAKVLEIVDIYNKPRRKGYSMHDSKFVYMVGKEVRPKNGFDQDRWNECSSGIHFFLTREEAIKY